MITRRALTTLAMAAAIFPANAEALSVDHTDIAGGSALRGTTFANATVRMGSLTTRANASGRFILPLEQNASGARRIQSTAPDGRTETLSISVRARVYPVTVVQNLPRAAGGTDIESDEDVMQVIQPGSTSMAAPHLPILTQRKIAHEAVAKRDAWTRGSTIDAFSSAFSSPLQTWRETSPWGSVREKHYLDGRIERVPHYGVDLGVDRSRPDGSNIYAPADGEVVLAGAGYYYEGNCVFLAHGAGLTTAYLHMNATPLVALGQRVRRGQQMGVAGATGSATGVHLCWRAKLLGVQIDPATLK